MASDLNGGDGLQYANYYLTWRKVASKMTSTPHRRPIRRAPTNAFGGN